ncbi:MAG: Undecaprenyl-diphosphatase [Candidatus Celerinatantimonas neptuna]|nr:MAG: Undecaprenyl-diphosphatase [Candidatus Celerinatantimonas neptuna]
MHIFQILILSIVQGMAELLPVSSSAHVIIAEKLMGLDPTTPAMTLLLVMLHTGTMFSVIVYFWKNWKKTYFLSYEQSRRNFIRIIIATCATGVVGLFLQHLIKYIVARGNPNFEIEQIFGDIRLIAVSLAVVGVFIISSSIISRRRKSSDDLSGKSAFWIGVVQGLCLPFRGFSRSGATISTGLSLGVSRQVAEEFSFALAVVLTPVVIVRELYRLFYHDTAVITPDAVMHMIAPGLLGMLFSFLAGLAAIRWLSKWLESGKWYLFGFYCLVASCVVLSIG